MGGWISNEPLPLGCLGGILRQFWVGILNEDEDKENQILPDDDKESPGNRFVEDDLQGVGTSLFLAELHASQ